MCNYRPVYAMSCLFSSAVIFTNPSMPARNVSRNVSSRIELKHAISCLRPFFSMCLSHSLMRNCFSSALMLLICTPECIKHSGWQLHGIMPKMHCARGFCVHLFFLQPFFPFPSDEKSPGVFHVANSLFKAQNFAACKAQLQVR